MLRHSLRNLPLKLSITPFCHGHGVAISVDGRGCWRDHVFVERLWRSIKHEEVYLHA